MTETMTPTPAVPLRPLSARQEAFVLGIVEGKTATQAYMDAYGVSEKVAAAKASVLVRNGKIVARLEQLRAKVEAAVVEKVAIDKQWVIDRFVRNVQISMREIPIEVSATEAGKKVEIFEEYNGSVANAALTKIGEELGMFRIKITDIPWDEMEAEDLKLIEKGILPFKLRKRA